METERVESAYIVQILLVEDNPAQANLLKTSLQRMEIPNNVVVATDGEQATDMLFKRGSFEESPRPDLVLLDLGLPKKTGFEVLAELKSDPDLRSIPVIVLTTSKSEEDILRSYDLHANTFITKPVGIKQLVKVVQQIEEYWLVTAKLPRSRHERAQNKAPADRG